MATEAIRRGQGPRPSRRTLQLVRILGFGDQRSNDNEGLTVGSLYQAYNDKEGLFAKALERYIVRREAEVADMLKADASARDLIEAVLKLYVRLSQGEEGKLGCLLVVSIAELAHFSHVDEVLRE